MAHIQKDAFAPKFKFHHILHGENACSRFGDPTMNSVLEKLLLPASYSHFRIDWFYALRFAD